MTGINVSTNRLNQTLRSTFLGIGVNIVLAGFEVRRRHPGPFQCPDCGRRGIPGRHFRLPHRLARPGRGHGAGRPRPSLWPWQGGTHCRGCCVNYFFAGRPGHWLAFHPPIDPAARSAPSAFTLYMLLAVIVIKEELFRLCLPHGRGVRKHASLRPTPGIIAATPSPPSRRPSESLSR